MGLGEAKVLPGGELEELRAELGEGVDKFAASVGVDPHTYEFFVSRPEVDDPGVVARVRLRQLDQERTLVDQYAALLERGKQSFGGPGPFGPGKVFSHLAEVEELRRDSFSVSPITVEWHLSNACNHDCPCCPCRASVRHTQDNGVVFDQALVGGIIADLHGMGVKGVVHCGGGEPLLNPRVPEILEGISKAGGIRQGLITNGHGAERGPVAEAIARSCDWVRFSADAGSQEAYARTHGRGADFEELLRSVRAVLGARARTPGSRLRVGVSFLLTTSNYETLVAAASTFREVGVDYFQVKPMVVPACERVAGGAIFWRSGMFAQLAALPAQATPAYRVHALGFKFVDMLRGRHVKSFDRCWAHPFYPTIAATGEVYVCCLMVGDRRFCYGRIDAQHGLRDVWASPRRAEVAQLIDVRSCPVNCKLSETNKCLQSVLGREPEDPCFLN